MPWTPPVPVHDPQRPTLLQAGLWAVVSVLALITTLISMAATYGVLFESQAATVDVAQMPAGTSIRTIENLDGTTSDLYDCPALIGRSVPAPSWCTDTDATSRRVALIAPILTLVAAFGAFACGRRAWSCLRRRSAPPPPWPPMSYRQEAMPWGFWLALVLVGALALLLDGIFIGQLLGGDLGDPRGAVFWTAVVVAIVYGYGWRSAVSLTIDGSTLVWRAPLRTIRVPVVDYAGYSPGTRSPLGERNGTIHLRDGSSLTVSVPNRRHAVLAAGFFGIPVT